MVDRRTGASSCLIERIDGIALLALVVGFASSALAAGSNMPWEGPLQSVLESIEGPVARIVFGLSIAFAASSFFLSFFSFAGGAVVA